MTSGLFYRDPEGNEHDIGDDACMGCWPWYPRACSCPNPARLHVWLIWLTTEPFAEPFDPHLGYYCEKCGPVGAGAVGD